MHPNLAIHACFALFLTLFLSVDVIAQSDSIVIFDVSTQESSLIAPVEFDSTVIFDKTDHNFGTRFQAILPLTPPDSNVYDSTRFTRLARAQNDFQLEDYPISTAVSIRLISNDTSIRPTCSGIMVGENVVLTTAHCFRNLYAGNATYQRIDVAPAYDNGRLHPIFSKVDVSKIYLFKSYFDRSSMQKDFALLELTEPVGRETGWMGMAFTTDSTFFNNKVFHKLSYPIDASFIDSTIQVNGDTLYYNYGAIDVLSDSTVGLISEEARGIPGQSGSSLFYTDLSEYYTLALAVFSYHYNHFKISNEVFYQFKNLLENYTTQLTTPEHLSANVEVYPNPSSDACFVELSGITSDWTWQLHNAQGQLVQIETVRNQNKVRLDLGHLANGLFRYTIHTEGGPIGSGNLVIIK